MSKVASASASAAAEARIDGPHPPRFLTVRRRLRSSASPDRSAVAHIVALLLLPLLFVAPARSFRPPVASSPRPPSSLPMSAPSDPVWDPVRQIYVGGTVPSHATDPLPRPLRIFGYGSLCWRPDGVLARPEVSSSPGWSARGYRRAWAQRSTDHRGVPSAPGIVCTMLAEAEHAAAGGEGEAPLTEGVLYTVPDDLAEACLAELDFREKGGYARDVVDVVRDADGTVVKALLYRGTPDNPAFWSRCVGDLDFAAAIISRSVGPSGPNKEYLLQLESFLKANGSGASNCATIQISDRVRTLLDGGYRIVVVYGAGSNQHGQLLRPEGGDEDAHELIEVAVALPPLTVTEDAGNDDDDVGDDEGISIWSVHAGGGHCALLDSAGRAFLWGWNACGQLGAPADPVDRAVAPVPVLRPLPLRHQGIDLGHAHTLLVGEDGLLRACGDDAHGQCSGKEGGEGLVTVPTVPEELAGVRVRSAAGGVRHSAVATEEGDLATLGDRGRGQCLESAGARWRPADGARVVDVACGWRHTAVLDERGRVYTLGDDGHGQLGRDAEDPHVPRPVDGPLGSGEGGLRCVSICCGWSHTIALCQKTGEDGSAASPLLAYGWGRNDRGQLGMGNTERVARPQLLFKEALADAAPVEDVECFAEGCLVKLTDGRLLSCGWNEHGNLGTGDVRDRWTLTPIGGGAQMPVVTVVSDDHDDNIAPGQDSNTRLVGAGGAVMLAMMSD